ncbi:MAG: hypothetical protein M1830_007053, partial [Pleopsidium flavum]
MPTERYLDEEEAKPLTQDDESQTGPSRDSLDSITSASTTSLVFERLNGSTKTNGNGTLKQQPHQDSLAQTRAVNEKEDEYDIEEGTYQPPAGKSVDKRFRRIVWMLGALCLGGWILALFLFLSRQTYKHSSAIPHDPAATASRGSGKKVTLDQVLGGLWRPKSHEISWIAGAN